MNISTEKLNTETSWTPASGWATDADFVERMARHVQREAKDLSFVGDEWSDAASLMEVGKGWKGPKGWGQWKSWDML